MFADINPVSQAKIRKILAHVYPMYLRQTFPDEGIDPTCEAAQAYFEEVLWTVPLEQMLPMIWDTIDTEAGGEERLPEA